MSAAELLRPPGLPNSPAELSPAFRELRRFLTDTAPERPSTPLDDAELAVAFQVLVSELTSPERAAMIAALSANLGSALDDWVKREFNEADTMLKLACRQVGEAARVYKNLLNALPDELRSLAVHAAASNREGRSDERVARYASNQDLLALSLLPIALLTAVEAVDRDPGNFLFWAQKAVTSARLVEPRIHEILRAMSAEVARLEERGAWSEWDEEELASELNSWQKYAR